MCFYCTQSDILLCGIARFSRGNKNKLKTFSLKNEKIKNSQPQTKFTGFIKKKSVLQLQVPEVFRANIYEKSYVRLKQLISFDNSLFVRQFRKVKFENFA